MTSDQLRQKFLDFFEKNNHAIIPSSSLVPSDEEQLEGKDKVLFTSAGMQPLIPYLLGKEHPKGKRLADIQKSLRTDDIEEVGDLVHHTFFEMLGSWSLGDYFKEEAIKLSFKFLTEELNIPIEKLAVSVFAGDDEAPRDQESAKVWKSLGIPEERIVYLGKAHNWWPSGEKAGPCGPDTEMFYWTGEGDPSPEIENNPFWVEIWNDVFMEFNRGEDGKLSKLSQQNVDTGMGLERTVAVLNGAKSAYETDLFSEIIKAIGEIVGKKYGESEKDDRSFRIIADHIRASAFILGEKVEPSNKERGYILRRLIRRAITFANLLSPDFSSLLPVIDVSIQQYKKVYKELEKNAKFIKETYSFEEGRFKKVLASGLASLEKELKGLRQGDLFPGKVAFNLYQNQGMPVEITKEILNDRGIKLDFKEYEHEYKHHQETSRTAQAGKYKGGLAGHSETEIKYHTATHLLHQALRDVLGPEVFQKGSNINEDRLRFDYSYNGKPTKEEIKQVEDLINQKIREKLIVENKTISLEEAKEMNAIGLFGEKYSDKVSVYAIGPNYSLDPNAKDQRNRGGFYSLEFCGGPHVQNTSEVYGIKILKEESISSGIRRIRAILK